MSTSNNSDVLRLLALYTRKDNESLSDYIRRLNDILRLTSFSFDPASEITENDNKWDSWSSSADVESPGVLSRDAAEGAIAIQEQLQQIRQRVKYPGRLRHLLDRCTHCKSEYQVDHREEDAFIRNIVEWSKTVEHNTWDDDLSPDVLKLFLSWLATRRACDAESYELAQRAVADMLVQTVFSERLADKSPHITHKEQDILVPVNPNSQLQLSRAKADACTTKELPNEVQAAITAQTRKQPRLLRTKRGLQCLATQGEQFAYSILLGTFFCEWKRDIGICKSARQCAFYGLGMQDQRRALGLPSRPVYGSAMAGGVLHLVITNWEYSVLAVRYTTGDLEWDLRQPSKLVECFYFLCALKAEIDKDFGADMEAMKLKLRLDNDIVDWGIAQTRVNNWDVSNKKTNPEPSDVRPAKKRCRGDQDDNSPQEGRSGGPGSDDKRSNDRGGGRVCRSDGGQAKDNTDTMVSNCDDSEEEGSHFDDAASNASDASGKFLSHDEENLRCASIANWRVGRSYPVFDLEAWRRDDSEYMFG